MKPMKQNGWAVTIKYAWKAQAAIIAEEYGPGYCVYQLGEYYYVLIESSCMPETAQVVYRAHSAEGKRWVVYNRGTDDEREEEA